MADNTALNPGVGGDTIATVESIDRSSGVAVSVKTQVVLVSTANGVISTANPLPTEDAKVIRLLEQIASQNDTIISQNDKQIEMNKAVILLLS